MLKMFKKASAFVLTAAIGLSCVCVPALAAEAAELGDGNEDGMISVSDVVYLRGVIMDSPTLTEKQLAVMDVDFNGVLTVADVVTLREMIMDGSKIPIFSEGWNEFDGSRYYYSKGQLLTGTQTINGLRYEFDSSGVCLTHAGVDVSVYQSTSADWSTAAAQGVEFAMVRIGYRGYGSSGKLMLDSAYSAHMSGAAAAGIDTGVYFFSQAVNAAEGAEEANYVLKNLGSYQISYPIAIDVEYVRPAGDTARADGISKADRTAAVKAFCEAILAAGYYPVIYANPDMCSTGLNMADLSAYDFWLAHYTDETSFSYPYQIWQYSSQGSISGLTGLIDIDMSYRDYPAYLKVNGYNKGNTAQWRSQARCGKMSI